MHFIVFVQYITVSYSLPSETSLGGNIAQRLQCRSCGLLDSFNKVVCFGLRVLDLQGFHVIRMGALAAVQNQVPDLFMTPGARDCGPAWLQSCVILLSHIQYTVPGACECAMMACLL